MAMCASAAAQQPTQTIHLGALLASTAASEKSRIDALRDGLRDLGYIEGKNIVIEWRYANLKFDRLNEFAAELVRLKVNIIVIGGSTSTRAAKQATTTIPIVMGQSNDPVGEGFVASLARPGGNITGLSTLAPEITGKQLEVLKDSIPRISRVAVYKQSTNQAHLPMLKELDLVARALNVQLQYLDVISAKDISTAFRDARAAHADAGLILPSPVTVSQRTQIAELAAQNRLPVVYPFPEAVETGGLMSYGVSWPDLFRRAATYVDKILKGAKPADLPVEQPAKFELIINLKAAKQIGLTIPPQVLARADRVIR